MTEELTLLSCPFCGGCARIGIVSFDGSPDMYRVGCMVCGGGVELYDTKEEAKAAWNSRYESDKLPEWFVNAVNAIIEEIKKDVSDDSSNMLDDAVFQINTLKHVLDIHKLEE